MSTEIVRPWVPTKLTPPVTKKTLSMQMAEVLATAYADDIEDTYALVTTTDNDDAVEGSPEGDDWRLTFLIRKLAQTTSGGDERWPDLVRCPAKVIHANLHYAKRRVSPDLVRSALIKAKADYQAVGPAPWTPADDPEQPD